MIPQFPNSHPVFDEWPVKQNYPCPVSKSRLRYYQRQIDRIAGKASNGRSNVRVIWAADPDTRISGQIIDGEWKARYAIRTETYECTRKEGELDVVEFVDVDIVAPRFVFEQFHEPAEAAFNPSSPDTDGEGYYTHLFTVGFHDETCCAGREAANGSICLGAYQEPSDTHLDYLRMLIRLRNEQKQVRMIGDPITSTELAEDYRRVRSWGEQRDVLTRQGFAGVALDSLRLHGWRASNTDGGKRSKFQFLNNGLVKGIHY